MKLSHQKNRKEDRSSQMLTHRLGDWRSTSQPKLLGHFGYVSWWKMSAHTPCLRMNQFPYRGHEACLVRARVSFNGNSKMDLLERQELLSGWTHSRQPEAMRAMRRSNYLEPTPSSHKKLVLHMKDAKKISQLSVGFPFLTELLSASLKLIVSLRKCLQFKHLPCASWRPAI